MNNIGNIKSIIKLTAPHDVMISHPEEVAKILLEKLKNIPREEWYHAK